MANDDYTMGELYGGHKSARKARRALLGVECPMCKKNRPKTNASILLPQQRCKVDGYRDPRPIEEKYSIDLCTGKKFDL